jgi:translocator protein
VKLFFSLLITLSVGAIAGVTTVHNIDTWYATLSKPWFNPPNWVFAPVWTFVYILMAIALSIIWKMPRTAKRNSALFIFFLQLTFNFFWSFFFFYFHAIGVALADIVLLWVTIFTTILLFSNLKKSAGWLLVPYLAWVSFAMILNISIFHLNAV